jgi:hypothetical protein
MNRSVPLPNMFFLKIMSPNGYVQLVGVQCQPEYFDEAKQDTQKKANHAGGRKSIDVEMESS